MGVLKDGPWRGISIYLTLAEADFFWRTILD